MAPASHDCNRLGALLLSQCTSAGTFVPQCRPHAFDFRRSAEISRSPLSCPRLHPDWQVLAQQHGFDEVTDEQIAWRLGCGHHLSLFTWCDRALAHSGFGLCPIALACRCVPCVKPALQVPSIASISQRLDLRFYLRRIGRLRCSHGVLGVASMNVSPPCGALWASDQLALTSSPKDRFSLYEHRADFPRRGHIQAKCQQFRWYF